MRKASQISQNTLEAVIVVGIVVVLNLLGWYYHTRLDLTSDKQFTLAKSSRDLIANLPDRVTIKAYVSPNLPPNVQQAWQNVKDKLDEYRAINAQNLIVQVIRTSDLNEQELQALEQKGIEPRQHAEAGTEGEQLTLGNYYMGIEISYLGKTEVIPFAPEVENLEYKITSSILKLTSEEQPTVGFLVGHGETTQDRFSQLVEVLKELYNVQEVDLGTGRKVDDNIKTLVIVGPTQPFTERHRYAIDQFVMRGGNLVVMQVGYKIDQLTGQAQLQVNPLESLLAAYGVKIRNDMVVDLGYPLTQFNPRNGTFQQIPLIPVITAPDGFPSDNPATRGLTSLALPLVSSLELLYDKIPKETQIFELCKTSVKSYSHPLPINLQDRNPNWAPPGGESDYKPQLVAVQLTGVFTSAFQGKAVPALDVPPDAAPGTIPELDPEPMKTQSPQTSVVVIGASMFIEDDFIRGPGIGVFIMNLMESLNIGDKLIDVRTRTVTARPLKRDLKNYEKNALMFWGYGAVPVVITLVGVARFYLKAQRKRLLQTMQYMRRK